MARSGRLRKYDKIADDISKVIEKHENKKAIDLIKSSTIDILDGEARTPLIHAAFNNNIEMLKWLIKNGANINHQDRNGLSSLHGATIYGNIEVIKLLLENDADQNIVDAYGNNPLWTATHWACLKASTENNYKIVEELLKSGSNPHNKNLNGKTPFERSEGNPAIRQLFNKFIGENIGKL